MRVLCNALLGLASAIAANALGEPRVITFPTSDLVEPENENALSQGSAQTVFSASTSNDFTIASKERRHATPLLLDADDDEAVHLAAQTFARDVHSVTGVRPELYNNTLPAGIEHAIVVGTVESKLIQNGVKGLDYRELKGKWESYDVRTAKFHGVEKALVVAGSDRVSRVS